MSVVAGTLTICTIIFNGSMFSVNIQEKMVVTNSEARCLTEARKYSNGNIVLKYPAPFTTPEQLCGPNLKDCEDLR